jgi:hypothetical protein
LLVVRVDCSEAEQLVESLERESKASKEEWLVEKGGPERSKEIITVGVKAGLRILGFLN